MMHSACSRVLAVVVTALLAASCAQSPAVPALETETAMNDEPGLTSESDRHEDIPESIRAWMDRLTVPHEYDPETGFIVAREVIGLPQVIASGPPVPEALAIGVETSRLVVVFATADRCAPCQQYKKSALNDPDVVAALGKPGFLATHIEVDREPEAARAVLGSLAIPMTYMFADGKQVAVLPGQRSAAELLAWLQESSSAVDTPDGV